MLEKNTLLVHSVAPFMLFSIGLFGGTSHVIFNWFVRWHISCYFQLVCSMAHLMLFLAISSNFAIIFLRGVPHPLVLADLLGNDELNLRPIYPG